jgi:trk system potassium uptake protein TrkA
MRLIICGAGQVGSNIAQYLGRDRHDITIIDRDEKSLSRVSDKYDIRPILGHAADPTVLEDAGAKDAEMIIAATAHDETNMVACQVAHSIFHLPKKIARIRNQVYRDPQWADLFSRDNMPIDVIISPEVEVADTIAQRLAVPGAFNIFDVGGSNALTVAGIICPDDSPVLNTPIAQINDLFPDVAMRLLGIVRQGKILPVEGEVQFNAGDQIYIVAERQHIVQASRIFGYDPDLANRRVIVVGGGHIGRSLGKRLINQDISLRVIEMDEQQAEHIAGQLGDDAIVIHGDGMDRDLLEEAHIDGAEGIITVTDDDETNILCALLAKQYGCHRSLALVTKPVYSQLLPELGIDAVIDPRAVTVSSILSHVRRGRIKGVHSLRDGVAEVMDLSVMDTSGLLNTSLQDLDLPEGVRISAIQRDGHIILPEQDTLLRAGDRVIVFTPREAASEVERIFAVRLEYF